MTEKSEPDATAMNVSDGGKNRHSMRDTEWNGRTWQIGQKGLRTVLTERGMLGENDIAISNATGKAGEKLLKEDMVQLLQTCDDFMSRTTAIERLFASRGHSAIFYPKFHCGNVPAS